MKKEQERLDKEKADAEKEKIKDPKPKKGHDHDGDGHLESFIAKNICKFTKKVKCNT